MCGVLYANSCHGTANKPFWTGNKEICTTKPSHPGGNKPWSDILEEGRVGEGEVGEAGSGRGGGERGIQ